MIHGFDVSHWDGTVEWPKVPRDYKFVFIKATEGGYIPDHLADQHYIGAGQEGFLRSCYHFWRYNAPAAAQTREFIARIRWLEAQGGKMELPPVFDIEDVRAPKGSVLIPHIKACLQLLEQEFGRKPIIYTARWWTEPWLGDCSWLKEYPLWVARYTYNPNTVPFPSDMPKGLTKWTFWQWTDKAELPGIAENAEDGDLFNGSLEELYAFAGLTPPMSIEDKVARLWAAHPELHGG